MARLTLLALALTLVACGSVSGSNPPAATPTPTASPVGGQISDGDDGKTISLHVGDQVELVLHQQPGFTQWNGVQSSNPSVLMPVVDVRAAAVRGVTLAMFKAVGPGRSDVTASAGVNCSPGTACPALARLWRVTIQVS